MPGKILLNLFHIAILLMFQIILWNKNKILPAVLEITILQINNNIIKINRINRINNTKAINSKIIII